MKLLWKSLGPLIALSLVLSSFSAATTRAATGAYDTVNIAAGSFVTAMTDTASGSPSDVTDANLDTPWYSSQNAATNHVTFVVDIGSFYSIGRIDVSILNMSGFTVSSSTNNVSYSTLATWAWPVPIDGPVTVPVDGAKLARFLMFDGYVNAGTAPGVAEFEVYEWLTPAPPPPVGMLGTVNVALNRPVTSFAGTASPPNIPANANDGNTATLWQSNASDADNTSWSSIMIDLGQSYNIGRIVVDPKSVQWYRVFVTSNASPQHGAALHVMATYPDLFSTGTTTDQQTVFNIYGTMSGRYIWVWTQVDKAPSVIPTGLADIAVYAWLPPNSLGIGAVPSNFYFEASPGGTPPPVQYFSLWNTSSNAPMAWTASTTAAWLTVGQTAGVATGVAMPVEVIVNPAGLTPDTYHADVIVSAVGATNSPLHLPVVLVVGVPSLSLSPTTLTFTTTVGGNPASQLLTVSNAGIGVMAWSVTSDAPWLWTTPALGSLGTAQGQTAYINVASSGLAAGTYNGALTFTSSGAAGSPAQVNVSLTVNLLPAPAVTPASLTFNAVSGEPNPAAQTVSIANSGSGTLIWTAASNAAWLSGTPTSGSVVAGQPMNVSISVSTAGLAPGTYNGAITITPQAGAPVLLPVTLVLSEPPTPQVTPASLVFNGISGEADPAAQAISIANSGGGTLIWTAASNAAWLSASPLSGSVVAGQPINVSVSVSTTGLAAGTYNGAITITPQAGAAVQLPVTLVLAGPPAPLVSPPSLTFGAPPGGPDPPAQTISIANSGGGTLVWTAASNAAWLSGTPTSGSVVAGQPMNVSISVSTTGLAAGTYNGAITITPQVGAAVQLPVTLVISLAPALGVTPGSLTFNAVSGEANPPVRTINVANTGGGTLIWTAASNAAWLSVSPTGGSVVAGQPTNASVSVNITGLAPGTYNGAITVTPDTGAPVLLPVTLIIDPPPVMNVTPLSLAFNAISGGPNPAGQAVTVANSGGGTLIWTAASNAAWLRASPLSGSVVAGQPMNVSISVSTTGLAPGTHNGTVTITPQSGAPFQLPVTLVISLAPALGVTPGSLAFNAISGGSNPAGQAVTVANSGGGTLIWTANINVAWLSISPSSGSVLAGQPMNASISVSITGLPPGTHNGTVTITPNVGAPVLLPVVLVLAPPPAPQVSPVSLTFGAQPGGLDPEAQTISVANSGGGTLIWTAASNAAWLSASPGSGSVVAGQPMSVNVSVSIAGLAPGTHNGIITITPQSGAPVLLPVTLVIAAPPVLEISPASLVFDAAYGGSNPPAQTAGVANSGGLVLNWTAASNASWLGVTPIGGSTIAGQVVNISISVNITGLAPGTYNSAITITPQNAAPRDLPVSLVVSGTPVLNVSPASLSFATPDGSNPAAQTISIANIGGGTLNWTAADNAAWLSLSPTSGSVAAGQNMNLSVSVSLAGLAAGTYNGTVTVTPQTGAPVTVSVRLTVTAAPTTLPATINITPEVIQLKSHSDDNAVTAQIRLTGIDPRLIDVSTIRMNVLGTEIAVQGSPTSNGSNGLMVKFNREKVIDALNGRTGTFSFIVSGALIDGRRWSGSDDVKVIGNSGALALNVTPTSLTFNAIAGASSPPAQTIRVTNSTSRALTWTAADNAAWLSLSPTSGSVAAGQNMNLSVSVSLAGLAAGTYNGTVTVTPQTGAPVTVSVRLTVTAAPTTLPATINITPEVIQLKSHSDDNAVTAQIRLTGIDPRLIDVSTIRMNVLGTEIAVQGSPTSNGSNGLMVKFNREKVIDALNGRTGTFSFIVSGALTDGRRWSGSDDVKVIGNSDNNRDDDDKDGKDKKKD